MNHTESKIDFWIETWEDLIRNFLKKSYGLNLYSPSILIDDIITEIEENQFRNSDNKKFFQNKISGYLENDEVVKTELISEFTLLRKSFHTDRQNYILSLCFKIREKLKQGVYFNKTLDLINNAIHQEKEIDLSFVKQINYYSQSLITEFVKKSFALEDIKRFLNSIFGGYRYTQEYFYTEFPHPFKEEDFLDSDGKFQREEFAEKVKPFIDKLSSEDKINSLKIFYEQKPEEVKYIFLVKGIKGEVDKRILDVHFYNIESRRFAKENSRLSPYEDIQQFSGLKNRYVQAAVDIPMLTPKSSLSNAKSKIENTLDILSCYLNLKTNIEIDESNFIVINSKGRVIHTSFQVDHSSPVMDFKNALDLESIDNTIELLNSFDFLVYENNENVLKLKNALRWRHKAEQSFRDEDKLLNYWICLENLFNSSRDLTLDIFNDNNKTKFHLIQEIISSHQIFNHIFNYGWELYHYFQKYNDPLGINKKLPEELRKKAQLNRIVGERIYLAKFIECLPDLKTYEEDLFILDKIDSVISFYNGQENTKEIILDHKKQVKEDILMIYRMRNLIVHNAHYDNALLQYYIWKIRSYSGFLIRKFITKYDDVNSFEDFLLEIFVSKEKLLLDLDRGKVDLFNNKNLC